MHRIGDEMRNKIDTAIEKALAGSGAPVAPAKPRRLLVCSLHKPNGVRQDGHAAIDPGNYAIQRMGETSGAYAAFFSDDPSILSPENLAMFDAICFNNTGYMLTEDRELQQSLISFVQNGGGFAGFHAAAATFCQYPDYDQFPEYGMMIGGYENGGHPWGPEDTITITPEDKDSPINASFNGADFEIQDEVFQMKDHYTRDKLRVLLRINVEKSDFGPDRRVLPERRADRDLAISWIRKHGDGRVFYTSFGHNEHLYWNSPVLAHLLAGLQYVLGDLNADASPRPLPA